MTGIKKEMMFYIQLKKLDFLLLKKTFKLKKLFLL
jgi:hypothetical protein